MAVFPQYLRQPDGGRGPRRAGNMATITFSDSGDVLEIRKIVAIGANYTDHIREMGLEPPEAPMVFLKPATSVIHEGTPIVHPDFSRLMHHEVELGLVVGRPCKGLEADDAGDAIAGYFLALDMTLRDLQGEARERGDPWSVAKGFDGACPISHALTLVDPARLRDLSLTLAVNGEIRQDSTTANMIWTSEELVAIVSRFFTLERGDLILTGTPAGVGPVKRGDTIGARLGDELSFAFEVV